MPAVTLENRAIIELSGVDAESFLQNIVTTDLDSLPEGEARAGALLTPQGKILFDFLVSRHGPGALRLETRADALDDFLRRLTLYRLRADVQVLKDTASSVAVTWRAPSEARDSGPAGSLLDSRFPAEYGVRRLYSGGPGPQDDWPEDWTRFRIRQGIAESGSDYALGDAFPHDVLLDQNGGVSFKKGCYVGQEVVSRMQHRGTARRRVLIATGHGALPPAGTAVEADGKTIGTLGSVVGQDGLALARIDRVKDAIDRGSPITAAGVVLSLAIPAWARFTFPDTLSSIGEA